MADIVLVDWLITKIPNAFARNSVTRSRMIATRDIAIVCCTINKNS